MGKVTQGEVVGLAGIGLAGHMDVHKLAAAKMQMGNHNGNNGNGGGNNHSVSPSPKVTGAGVMHGGPSPINGAAAAPPPMNSPAPPQQVKPAV